MHVFEIYIKEYIDELQEVSQFALKTYQSCKKICSKREKRLAKRFHKLNRQYGQVEEYIIDELISMSINNKVLEYLQLSCQLQGICALLEHRMSNLFNTSNHADAVRFMRENYGFDFYKDNTINEIWLVYNVLKHGKNGKSGQELQAMGSQYLCKSNYFEEIIDNNDIEICNIKESDIVYFTGQIVLFWETIIARLPQKQ